MDTTSYGDLAGTGSATEYYLKGSAPAFECPHGVKTKTREDCLVEFREGNLRSKGFTQTSCSGCKTGLAIREEFADVDS